MGTQTHTFAKLGVSQAVLDEIWEKLAMAGYRHQLHVSDLGAKLIDMHGIALVLEKQKSERKRKPLKIK